MVVEKWNARNNMTGAAKDAGLIHLESVEEA